MMILQLNLRSRQRTTKVLISLLICASVVTIYGIRPLRFGSKCIIMLFTKTTNIRFAIFLRTNSFFIFMRVCVHPNDIGEILSNVLSFLHVITDSSLKTSLKGVES